MRTDAEREVRQADIERAIRKMSSENCSDELIAAWMSLSDDQTWTAADVRAVLDQKTEG